MVRKIVLANHHWKRTRETQDTSVQSILKVVHKRTHVLVLFSLASKHSPLHLREVVRSYLQSWEPLLKNASSCQSVWDYTYSLWPVQPKVTFETSNTLTTRSTWLASRAGKTWKSTTSSLKRLFRLYRWSRRDPAGFHACKDDVYLGPKDLDEKVSELHLPALGPELTVLTQVTERSRLKALSRVSTTVIGL